jgi:hypothetical protein
MNYIKYKYFHFLLFAFISFGITCLNAQSGKKTIVKGLITDAKTEETLPFVTIMFSNKRQVTTSDNDGNFVLITSDTSNYILFSYIGYVPQIIKITPGQSQYLEVKMKSDVKILNEVVITPGKKKRYRNKNNPAVELIGNVIDHKSMNESKNYDYIEYEKYEKNIFALSNITDNFKKKRIFKKFQFVFKNIDTTKIEGKEVLPIYIKESLSDYYFKKPNEHKEIVKADKMVSFEGYVDNQGVTAYLKYFYQDINIYNDNIIFVSNQFLSPIAFEAPLFYKYFILDTTIVDHKKCVHVAFVPRNKTDLLFQGELYILLDSTYAVKKVNMTVNKAINLNWVQSVKIKQDYENIENKGYFLSKDEMDLDFGVTQNGIGIYGERVVTYKNIKVDNPEPDTIYNGLPLITALNSDNRSEEYWKNNRPIPLTKTEQGTYQMIDSIKNIPAFKNTLDIIVLIWAGYFETKYVEIGPVGSFYSYNPIEGSRVRFGGRTTPQFSKKITFESYSAYGTSDKKLKYLFSTTYSFTNRTIYQFPVKYLKLSYQYDTKIPGEQLDQLSDDNIFLTLKRGVNNKMFYNNTFKIEHYNEFENHFSYTLGYQFLREVPAGVLSFTSNGINKPYIEISEPYIALRYAPNEQFYQGKQYRSNVSNGYPVFQLQCNFGSKKLNNFYSYENVRLTVSKRFYFSMLGFTDVIWESGKIFGQVPYPLLNISRANQSYSYAVTSYNLMNFLEFVNDQYTALNIDHNFYGFFLNKIPVLRHLKLREVATCKILFGSLSSTNDPVKHPELFSFPLTTYSFDKKPYIEGSVGIANIFKIFRVDLVKRFTYLDHPDVASWGIRAIMYFDF